MAGEINAPKPAVIVPPDQGVSAFPVPALRPDAGQHLTPTDDHRLPANPRLKRRWWLWASLGLLGLAVAFLASYQVWISRPPSVVVEVVALAPVTRLLAVNGRMATLHQVDVQSVVTGSLTSLPVSEGDRVEAGQVLAQVDAAAQNAMVRQAVAGLDAALVAQQQASEAYDRAVLLGSTIATATLETAAFALEAADEEVARQTALLDQASITVENFTIRAPFAGVVLELNTEDGQIVGPAIPLLTLADMSDLVVEADVDEAYARQIALDQPAVLQLAGETQTHEGHVSFLGTSVNVATGGLAIKIAFEAPVIAPIGLTVTTNIIVDQREAALTVPRSAILQGEAEVAVFIIAEGTAQRRPLSVVDWPAARLIVTQGLSEGDVVILDAQGIEDGQAVVAEQP